MSRVYVELTDQEVELVKDFTDRVIANHKSVGDYQDTIDKKHTPYSNALLGWLGEYAANKYLGTEFDFTNVHPGGDDWDIETVNGNKLEIKTIRYTKDYQELRMNKKQFEKSFTHAVLVMHIHGNKYEIVGWTTKKMFSDIGQNREIVTVMKCMPASGLEEPYILKML